MLPYIDMLLTTKTIMLVTIIIAVLTVWLPALIAIGSDPAPGMAITETLPGAEPFAPALLDQMTAKRGSQSKDYTPRTRHKSADGWARFTNRLFLETSPYLSQHAHNPVNWYPWGDEAFEAARRLNRPVLLSVGYSTCHWCHVMEEESFEDLEIAAYLNANYVAIKVDREERPDIDAVYMQAVQAMTGRGGWPMNVWLTADRRPFFGGTYFPPRDGDRGAGTGFLTLLTRVKAIYDDQPERVADTGRQLTQALQRQMNPVAGDQLPDDGMLHAAAAFYQQRFDPAHGGIQGAPKFPSSLSISFLLRYHRRTGDQSYLQMANLTLAKMARGGIHDHVGGGFHRYSTDATWLVPHFEKMLYDNALLASAYLEAYQVSDNPAFRAVVDDILGYVSREMTAPGGGFYSATDADSLTPTGHVEEGYFFTWTEPELTAVLGPKMAPRFGCHYGVSAAGNFEGRNILHRPQNPRDQELTADGPADRFTQARQALYQARLKRPAPLKDDKILTAWNGLMISAFARGAFVMDRSDYLARAARAANFILDHLFQNQTLYRSFRENHAKQEAFLEDHAFFIAALLDLFEASADPRWLKRAIELDAILAAKFEDPSDGGFFRISATHEALLAREKPYFDGAIPSGNAVAVLNLLRLHAFTSRDAFRQRAESAFKAFAPDLQRQPAALAQMLMAVDFYLDEPKEIVIVTPPDQPETAAPFLTVLRRTFVPNRIVAVATSGQGQSKMASLVPLAAGKMALQNRATAYVCQKGVCLLPTTDPKEFGRLINQILPLKAIANASPS